MRARARPARPSPCRPPRPRGSWPSSGSDRPCPEPRVPAHRAVARRGRPLLVRAAHGHFRGQEARDRSVDRGRRDQRRPQPPPAVPSRPRRHPLRGRPDLSDMARFRAYPDRPLTGSRERMAELRVAWDPRGERLPLLPCQRRATARMPLRSQRALHALACLCQPASVEIVLGEGTRVARPSGLQLLLHLEQLRVGGEEDVGRQDKLHATTKSSASPPSSTDPLHDVQPGVCPGVRCAVRATSPTRTVSMWRRRRVGTTGG